MRGDHLEATADVAAAQGTHSPALIRHVMGHLDALEAGDMRVFITTRGKSIGASIRVEIKDGPVLRSPCGYGPSADAAILDLWRQLTELEKPSQYLVVNAGREGRRAVRWNGFAFKTQYEPERDLAVPLAAVPPAEGTR